MMSGRKYDTPFDMLATSLAIAGVFSLLVGAILYFSWPVALMISGVVLIIVAAALMV